MDMDARVEGLNAQAETLRENLTEEEFANIHELLHHITVYPADTEEALLAIQDILKTGAARAIEEERKEGHEDGMS